MYSLAIFDLDGTLLDTLGDLHSSVNFALRKFRFPERTIDEVRSFIGNGVVKLMERSTPENTDEETQQRCLDAFRKYYLQHMSDTTAPYVGVTELIKELRAQGIKIAVVSNKPDSAVKALCAEYFPGVYALGESVDCPRKPAPDMVRKAMAAIGVEHCVYVGDSEVDVATAKNADVPCLSVLWGFRDKEELERSGAVQFCTHPSQIFDAIEKLLSAST
jgi:phosphoglycolate phosphatase